MTPYRSQMSRTVGQYSSPGTLLPPAAGSPITAATVSGLCSRIRPSIAFAHSIAHSDASLPPSSHRYGSG